MKYKYIGDGAFITGLPAIDLDDKTLDDAQLILLVKGIEAGMYVKAKSTKSDEALAVTNTETPTVSTTTGE